MYNNFKLITQLLVIIYLKILITSGVRSGLYIDNGYDQTVMHHELTIWEKQEMETGLLNVLGLPHRPTRKPVANNATNLRRSSTRFLMEIYKSLMEKENTGRMPRDLPEMKISQQELNSIDEIMTFESHDNAVSGMRHERGQRLWFDVSEIPAGETILTAEIRIYQDPEYAKIKTNKAYTIVVYEVVTTEKGERELEYVAAVNTSTGYEGWLELNLTRTLNSWLAFPHSNLGVYLSVHATDKPGHEIKPDDIGLVNTRGDPDKQPFMVAFFKASPTSAKKRKPRGIGRKRKPNYNSPRKYRDTMIESGQTSRNCQMQTLYVSFQELQWQDWIIAPVGFEAFYCTGECSFPLNAHMNATNHAIVQTLVHLMNPANVPKPCCAPTKLSAISVLYFRDENEVTLKKYKNMVVKSCGCH